MPMGINLISSTKQIKECVEVPDKFTENKVSQTAKFQSCRPNTDI